MMHGTHEGKPGLTARAGDEGERAALLAHRTEARRGADWPGHPNHLCILLSLVVVTDGGSDNGFAPAG
jgi:hypothetical protein